MESKENRSEVFERSVVFEDTLVFEKMSILNDPRTLLTENLMVRSSRTPTAVQKKLLTKPWPCPTCVSGQSLLPIYQYTLSDARCVKSKRQTLILQKSEIDSLSAYTTLPDDNRLVSCVTEYNSMYSSVVGRYIRLYSLDSSDFILNHMSVYDKLGTLISQPTNVIYCSSTAANSPNVDIILNSVSTLGADFTSNGGYIQLDLFSNMAIGYVKLSRKPASSLVPQTLTGKWIMVLKDLDTNTVTTNPLVVFNYQFGTITSQMTLVYTQNFATSNTYPIVTDPFETFPDPCTNCTTTSGKLLKGYKYNKNILNVNYCFKAKVSGVDPSALLSYETNLSSLGSCGAGAFPVPYVYIPTLVWTIDASDSTIFEFSTPDASKNITSNCVKSIKMRTEDGRQLATFGLFNVRDLPIVVTADGVPGVYYDSVNKLLVNEGGYLDVNGLWSNTMIPLRNTTLFVVGHHIGLVRSEFVSVSRYDSNCTIEPTSYLSADYGYYAYLQMDRGNQIEYTAVPKSTEYNYMINPSNMHCYVYIITDNYQEIFIDGVSKVTSTYAMSTTDSTTTRGQWSHLTTNFALAEMKTYTGRCPRYFINGVVAELKTKWSITNW